MENTIGVWSLAGSLVSVVVGGFAIILSVIFFLYTNGISRSTLEAFRGINEAVDRLEKLFDTFYSDAFGVMRDTVTDMRRHIWPETHKDQQSAEDVEQMVEGRISDLRSEITEEFQKTLKERQNLDEAELEERFGRLMERTIRRTREVEGEARVTLSSIRLRNAILAELTRAERAISAEQLMSRLHETRGKPIEVGAFTRELNRLKDHGVVEFHGFLQPRSVIRMLNRPQPEDGSE